MKIEATHIAQIKQSFNGLQSKADLLRLLNEAKPFVFGDDFIPFTLRQITWYSNPKIAGSRYHMFVIKKRNGTDRIIHARDVCLQWVLGKIIWLKNRSF